jgi:hypothetical protein
MDIVFKDNSSAEDAERMKKVNREIGLDDSTDKAGNSGAPPTEVMEHEEEKVEEV